MELFPNDFKWPTSPDISDSCAEPSADPNADGAPLSFSLELDPPTILLPISDATQGSETDEPIRKRRAVDLSSFERIAGDQKKPPLERISAASKLMEYGFKEKAASLFRSMLEEDTFHCWVEHNGDKNWLPTEIGCRLFDAGFKEEGIKILEDAANHTKANVDPIVCMHANAILIEENKFGKEEEALARLIAMSRHESFLKWGVIFEKDEWIPNAIGYFLASNKDDTLLGRSMRDAGSKILKKFSTVGDDAKTLIVALNAQRKMLHLDIDKKES